MGAPSPDRLRSMTPPVITKGDQARQSFAILGAIRRTLAGNEVVRMADRKALDVDMAGPRVREALNPVGSEYQVHIKGPIFQLHKVLAAHNFLSLGLRQVVTQVAQRLHESLAIFHRPQG